MTNTDLLATDRVHSRRMFLVAAGACAVAALSVMQAWSISARYSREAHLTYVKLSPNGTWDLAQDLDQHVLYFDSTLRTVLYDFIERRYSMRAGTISADWGIAYSMYAPNLQKWFVESFGAYKKASSHAGCTTCEQTVVRVRTHQHLDPLPANAGESATAPVRTLLYGSEQTYHGDLVAATSEKRMLFRVTWRLLSKAQIQSRPELLRYNPIGLEILDVEETADETTK